MSEHWFKRRRYGWGFVPATKEGWLAIVGFVAIVIAAAIVMAVTAPDGGFWPITIYLVVVAASAGGLMWVTQKKGPPGRWRWGKKPDDDPADDY